MKKEILKLCLLCLCLFGCLQTISGQDVQRDDRLSIPYDATHRVLMNSEDLSLFDKDIYLDAYSRFWMAKDNAMLCADFSGDSLHLEFLKTPPEIKKLKGLLWLTPENLIVMDGNILKIFQDGVFRTLSQLPYNNMNMERASDSTFYVFGKTNRKAVSYELYYCDIEDRWLKLGDFKEKINAVCGNGIMTLVAIGKKIYVFDHITGTHVLYSGNDDILSLATTWNGNLFFSTATSIIYNDDLKDIIAFSNVGASKIWSYADNLYVLYMNNVLAQISPVSSFKNFSQKKSQTLKWITDAAQTTNSVSPDTISLATLSDNGSVVVLPVSVPEAAVAETPVAPVNASDLSLALPSNVTEAIDYVTEVKGLVDLLQIKQNDFTSAILKWDKQIEIILEEIGRTNSAIAQTEKELDNTKNSAATGVTQEINTLRNTLSTQRNVLKQLKQIQADEGRAIVAQLQEIAKRDAADISKEFEETAKRITSAGTFPAQSNKRTTITFSEDPGKLPIVTCLKATDDLPVWYWHIENSFLKIIDEQNRKAQNFIDEYSKLSIHLQTLRKQLAEYQKEPEIRKNEIKNMENKVAVAEKTRENVSSRMKKEADSFAAYLKNYNNVIQGEYRDRIQSITEEVNYSFHQN
ncbi:MAG: hypothetical protein LBK97_01335 [Prevotellaceae bacterium]|jgi:hypothetical protein|nr:hypothetical protein [Prevotellaceae bacterium]